MADIELVIKIPESRYRLLQKQARTSLGREKLDEFAEAVLNSIPLPKGHGRLIDENELLKMTNGYKSELGRLKADPFVKCGIETVENFINTTPTIIEADTESEE